MSPEFSNWRSEFELFGGLTFMRLSYETGQKDVAILPNFSTKSG